MNTLPAGRLLTGALALLVGTAWCQQTWGAEAVDDYLSQDWYVTELIVFQRPAVMEFNTTERLLVRHPKAFPLAMRTLFNDPAEFGDGYPLDTATLRSLEPAFTTTRAPRSWAVADAGAASPRRAASERQAAPGTPPPAIAPTLEANELIDFLAAVAEFEETLAGASYRWTATSEHVLRRSSAVLTRRFGSRVLLHGRWLQPVPARSAAEPFYVRAGPRIDEVHQLEGSLSITLGRYLHFHAQLVYAEPGIGQAPVSLPFAPMATSPAFGASALAASAADPNMPIAQPPPALPALVPGYMVLDESRRMRSEEVHYLDHPKLGIIVRVDPVTIPEALQLRFQALKERDE